MDIPLGMETLTAKSGEIEATATATIAKQTSSISPIPPDEANDIQPVEVLETAKKAHMETVLDFWKEFDLDGRRLILDKQGLEMQDSKEISMKSRKKLAEMTKEFKKASADNNNNIKPDDLLKAYQKEIDALTRRSRSSENAFLNLYKDLYEAPDPSSVLQTAISERSKYIAKSLELKKLKSELSEYDEEFSNLKNQDVTIRKLEEQIIQYELSIENKVQEGLDLAKEDVEEIANARVKDATTRERSLERRLKEMNDMISMLQSQLDRSQSNLFELQRQSEEEKVARQSEYDLLLEASERYQANALSLQRENEKLLNQLNNNNNNNNFNRSSSSGSGGSGIDFNTNDDPLLMDVSTNETRATIKALESQVTDGARISAHLREKLFTTEQELMKLKTLYEGNMLKMTKTNEHLEKELLLKNKELISRPTKEDLYHLRSQLQILQQLEFNVIPSSDDDIIHQKTMKINKDDVDVSDPARNDNHHIAEPDALHNPEETHLSVEQILMKRIRRLEGELTTLRRNKQENKEKISKIEMELIKSMETIQEKKQLIQNLENDLLTQSSFSDNNNNNASSSSSSKKVTTNNDNNNNNNKSSSFYNAQTSQEEALSEMLGLDSENIGKNEESLKNINNNNKTSRSNSLQQQQEQLDIPMEDGDETMTKILRNQRDRFKIRIQQLENEKEILYKDNELTKVNIETLQKDNSALYEKLRFLQNYQQQNNYNHSSSSARNTSLRNNNNNNKGALTTTDLLEQGSSSCGNNVNSNNNNFNTTEARYRTAYEIKHNPFYEFTQNEKQRKYGELSVAEKITLNTTRFFLANKIARNFIFFYILILHLLVSFTLSHLSVHQKECGTDHPLDQMHLPQPAEYHNNIPDKI